MAGVAFAVVSAAAAAYSADRQEKAAREQRRAQRKANEVEQRTAEISNQRARKEAARELVMRQAYNTAVAEAGGSNSASTLQGVNTGLSSSFGSQIGYSNTLLASAGLKANTLQQGADKAGKYMGQAAWGGVVSQAASQGYSVWGGPAPKQSNQGSQLSMGPGVWTTTNR